MKILFCSSRPLVKYLGASKVIIELSEEMTKYGWICDFVDPEILIGNEVNNLRGNSFRRFFSEKLYNYIRIHGSKFDVIEYEHLLAFEKRNLPEKPLYVARSVLLAHHFKNIRIPMTVGSTPIKNSIKSKIKSRIFYLLYKKQLEQQINLATKACQQADLVNVSNFDDKRELVVNGIDENKIVVLPYGLNDNQRNRFKQLPEDIPLKPLVVFVGTFDNRKGATDIPIIFENIINKIPNTKLRLLGVLGLYRSKDEILSHFNKKLHDKIEIIERYNPEDLHELLKDCSIGIFPSYIEGFGFAVLEMLAASIPVIAYNSPGVTMMLTEQYLVSPGNINQMSNKIVELLKNKENLKLAKVDARDITKTFRWENIAKETSDIYIQSIRKKHDLMN